MDYLQLLWAFVYAVLGCLAWALSYSAYRSGVFRGIGTAHRQTQPFGFWLGVATNLVAGFFLVAIAAQRLNLL